MKTEYRKMLDDLVQMDPAANSLVKSVRIYFADSAFEADDVTLERGVLYARGSSGPAGAGPDRWLICPEDEIKAIKVELDVLKWPEDTPFTILRALQEEPK